MNSKKVLFLSLGILFLVIGFIGIFLPVLPTTPFLIVAAFFFEKSSHKFHNWLISHPRLGQPILDWQKHRVIETKFKIIATIMMGISSAFILYQPQIPEYGKIGYGVTISIVLIFIWLQAGKKP